MLKYSHGRHDCLLRSLRINSIRLTACFNRCYIIILFLIGDAVEKNYSVAYLVPAAAAGEENKIHLIISLLAGSLVFNQRNNLNTSQG